MHVEDLIIPHVTSYVSSPESIVSRNIACNVRDLGHPQVQGPQLPSMAISSILHHLSPF